MTLEHLKLLAPKAAQFTPGTGGTPVITFQEVADALATVSPLASQYARYRFAGEYSQMREIRVGLLLMLFGMHQVRKQEMPPGYWTAMIDLATMYHAHHEIFSIRRKARMIHRKRWRQIDEKNFILIINLLDDSDHELRSALRAWNEKQFE